MSTFLQHFFQKFPRIGIRILRDLLGSARDYHRSAPVAALGTYIYNIIRRFYQVKIVLDHQHGISVVSKPLKYLHQPFYVRGVKPRGGLVQNIDGLSRGAFGKLRGELYALRLAARERCGGLPYLDITEPHVVQRFQLVCYFGDIREELNTLLDRHIQHVENALALVFDLQRFAVVAVTLADLAGHENIRPGP